MALTPQQVAEAQALVPRISPDDARAMIDDRDALLVDVREDAELAPGRLEGAHHTPLGQVPFRADADSEHHDPAYRRDRPVILYCRSGGRSAVAGRALQEMGYADVFNLGGFDDIAGQGWPVAR